MQKVAIRNHDKFAITINCIVFLEIVIGECGLFLQSRSGSDRVFCDRAIVDRELHGPWQRTRASPASPRSQGDAKSSIFINIHKS